MASKTLIRLGAKYLRRLQEDNQGLKWISSSDGQEEEGYPKRVDILMRRGLGQGPLKELGALFFVFKIFFFM